MLDHNQATVIAEKNLPGWHIQKMIEYRGLFVFQMLGGDPEEAEYDPFYSVNKTTGEFAEFSVLTDGNIQEIMALFASSI